MFAFDFRVSCAFNDVVARVNNLIHLVRARGSVAYGGRWGMGQPMKFK